MRIGAPGPVCSVTEPVFDPPRPSVTVTVSAQLDDAIGAAIVKCGFCAAALSNEPAHADVHAYARGSPSASDVVSESADVSPTLTRVGLGMTPETIGHVLRSTVTLAVPLPFAFATETVRLMAATEPCGSLTWMVRVCAPSVAGAVQTVAAVPFAENDPPGADHANVSVSPESGSCAVVVRVTVWLGAIAFDDAMNESITGTALANGVGGLACWRSMAMTTVESVSMLTCCASPRYTMFPPASNASAWSERSVPVGMPPTVPIQCAPDRIKSFTMGVGISLALTVS